MQAHNLFDLSGLDRVWNGSEYVLTHSAIRPSQQWAGPLVN